MTGEPLASVVVPTYEGEAYLDECLASVATQDLRGVEVLVSDDASTDGTLDIARSWSERIPGLRIERNAERLGAVGNVNRCLRLARGTWVKPVFQDDLIESGCLGAMLAVASPRVPAVVGRRTYQFEGDVPAWQRDACDALLAASLTARFGGGPITKEQVAAAAALTLSERRPQLNFVGEPVAVLLHRRTALRAGGFDEGYAQLWDYELLVRLGARRGLVLLDEPIARFRVHGDSETARNLAGSGFATNVVDRLRLLVAYATERSYRSVRAAALAQDPPADVVALAVGASWAARRLASEQPPDVRSTAEDTVERLAARLPRRMRPPWPGSYLASRYMVELLHELSQDVDRAVAEVYGSQRLAVDLADPPPGTGGPVVTTAGSEQDPAAAERGLVEDLPPAREGRTGAWGKVRRGAHALRANQWWNHMLGPVTAFALLQVGWRDAGPGEAYPRLAALLVSAMALAAFGYVVNDAADIEPDRRAGKPNSMATLRPVARLGVMAAFAVVGVLPWLIVPLGPAGWAALAGIYLVPLLYSPEPLRLKENPLLGPLADAGNAFVLPALFTVALYAPVGPADGPDALMVAGAVAWAAGFGLRAILLHQVDDVDNDRASGTATLVTRIGVARAVAAMRRILFPLEVVGLALLAATVATWAAWAVASVLVGLVVFHGARLGGVLDRTLTVTTVERGWLLSWTQVWPALGLGVVLTVLDWRLVGLPILVAVLFWPRLQAGLRHLRAVVANERLRHRR